jgi:hypothetical protein
MGARMSRVDDGHFVAAGREGLDDVGSDEAGAAGHENVGHRADARAAGVRRTMLVIGL